MIRFFFLPGTFQGFLLVSSVAEISWCCTLVCFHNTYPFVMSTQSTFARWKLLSFSRKNFLKYFVYCSPLYFSLFFLSISLFNTYYSDIKSSGLILWFSYIFIYFLFFLSFSLHSGRFPHLYFLLSKINFCCFIISLWFLGSPF